MRRAVRRRLREVLRREIALKKEVCRSLSAVGVGRGRGSGGRGSRWRGRPGRPGRPGRRLRFESDGSGALDNAVAATLIPRAVALVRDIVAKAVAGNGMEQRKWTAVLKRVMAPSIKLSAAQIHSFIRLFVLLCPICGSLARPRPAPAPLSEREFSNDPKQSYRFIYLFSVVRGLSFFLSFVDSAPGPDIHSFWPAQGENDQRQEP